MAAKRSGIEILADWPGAGAAIRRQRVYQLRLRLWLNQGEAIRWDRPWGMIDRARLEDDGATLLTDLRIDRENLFAGLFQGIDGMCIGGRRKLKISPHLAYGERGLPGKIPPRAVIIAEIEFFAERYLEYPVMQDLADRIKVIAFDVFGTVVDWHGSVAREVTAMGLDVDANEFALAWRAGYQPAMQEVMRKGEWVILDELHRRILDRVLDDFNLNAVAEAERRRLNRVWHRLEPWPDSVAGLTRLKSRYLISTLSNGNIGLLTEMAKNAGLPWDCILCAETFRKYKPHPDTYLGVARTFELEPQQVMLAAAHHGDLEHARNCGLQTAYIERPFEYGRNNPKPVAPWDANTLHNSSIINLAEQLGC